MKQVAGVWLPDHEWHLVQLFERDAHRIDGRATYQQSKIEAALRHVRRFRLAIDVGAHVGLWTLQLARRFDVVMAIEPVAANRECFTANVGARDNVRLRACALGDKDGFIAMQTQQGSSGDSFVLPGTEGDVPIWRLDDVGDIGHVDFVKLDCAGYELPALRGMQRLLERNRPCICLEQKPGRGSRFGFGDTEALGYLRSLGAIERLNMSGVYVFNWGE